MDTISIAIVNDYDVVVTGLASMLRSYRDRVRVVELDTNRRVIEPVDIVLYDTFAAGQHGGADLRELARNPHVGRVVVYSWNLGEEFVDAALTDGASACVSKALPARDLVAALREIQRGGPAVHAAPPEKRSPLAGDWPGREEGLTARESEVLALLTQGLSNAEIAARAHLSVNSVKTHLRSCYRRIGVNTRSQALLWGIEHGFRPNRTRRRPQDPPDPA